MLYSRTKTTEDDGVPGQLGAWDFDAALTLGRLEQTATRTKRLRSSTGDRPTRYAGRT